MVDQFRYRILVVDDDEAIRRVYQEVLTQHSYDVLTASDGFEALALMRQALPDLIVSDLNMPKMSGFEFLSVARRRFPHIPVIAITGEYSVAAEASGLIADAVFLKGQYSPAQLFQEIRTLLELSPIRPHLPRPDSAPVWIPRSGGYVVLTCTECLRSFAITEAEADRGSGELACPHCDRAIRFRLEPFRIPANEGRPVASK